MPDYNYHFHRDDLEAALACLDEHGFCVIRQLIDREMVGALKDSIDRHLDPDGDLAPASNRYHMAFAEDSEAVWDLVDNPDYMRFIRTVHGTADLCLHRSAAILRTPGEGMGRWHQDHRGHIEEPRASQRRPEPVPHPQRRLVLSQREPSGSRRHRGHREIPLSRMGRTRRVRHGTEPERSVPRGRDARHALRSHGRARVRPGPRRSRRPDLLRLAHLARQHGHPRTPLFLRHRVPAQGLAYRRALAAARLGRSARRPASRPPEAVHRWLHGI